MPHSEPHRYIVYPTGWRTSPLPEKSWFCLYVERRDLAGDVWAVTDGSSELSSAGNWNYPHPSIRRFHRFTLAEALRRAEAVVDTRVVGRGTFAEVEAWWVATRQPTLGDGAGT